MIVSNIDVSYLPLVSETERRHSLGQQMTFGDS